MKIHNETYKSDNEQRGIPVSMTEKRVCSVLWFCCGC